VGRFSGKFTDSRVRGHELYISMILVHYVE